MPAWLRATRARLRALTRRNAIADEIREEIEFHVESRTSHYERQGLSRGDARRAALKQFGNPLTVRDAGYDVRGGGLVESIWQDVRYSLRMLRRQRGFAFVTLLTLALGIGLGTALYTVLDAAVLHPLPYPHPEQIVRISIRTKQSDGRFVQFGPALSDRDIFAAAPAVISNVMTWRRIFQPPLTDEPTPERLSGLQVTPGYLEFFGVTPLLGRSIGSGDMQPGAPNVLLLGYDFWQRRFNGAPAVVGTILRLDDGPSTIVGVLPRTFEHDAAILRPLRLPADMTSARGIGTTTFGRLRPGVRLEDAARTLTALLETQPGAADGAAIVLDSQLGDALRRNRVTANTLAAAVAVILLIACVNVAGLLLARGAARTPELALRASIGAGRTRLVRQLVIEALVLAACGGALGVLAAWWSLGLLAANVPISFSTDAAPTLNYRVLFFSLALSASAGLLFGLVPAWRLSRVSMAGALAAGSRRSGTSLSRRGGQMLIGAEIGLAVMLVIGAGLMLRSFRQILAVDLGFDPDGYLTFETTPVDPRGTTALQYYPALLDRIRALPEVAAAGAVDTLPLWSSTFSSVTPEGGAPTSANISQCLPGALEALGVRLQSGRLLNEQDRTSHRPVAVINQAGARRLFPDGSPLGRTIAMMPTHGALEIVGVVADLKRNGPLEAAGDRPQIYRLVSSEGSATFRGLTVIVKPSGAAAGLPAALRQIAPAIGPRVLTGRVRPGSEWFDDDVLVPRQRTVLLTLLGALGFVLALVGVFGTTAYAVTRRTAEIGVRMAFGARPRQIVGAVMKDAALPIAAGLGAGVASAAFATNLIAPFLFQTTPRDPATVAAAASVLALSAIVAAWIPARRAAHVDPIVALRQE